MRLRTSEDSVPRRCWPVSCETAAREAVLSRGVPDQPQNRCAQPHADREGDDWKWRKLDRDPPNGKSVYVATSTNGVWQYTINPTTGQLSPKKPESTGGTEHNIVIALNGENAYVIGDTRSGVAQYSINPRTGTLSSQPVSTAATVLHPEAIAIAPNGDSAYVTSENDGKVAQYTINPTTGKITPMSPATVPTASGSLGVTITP